VRTFTQTDNFHQPQWDSHPRIRTFTHHIIENSHPMGENSHPIRWELSLIIHTQVKTPTYSSGKRHPKEWELSPTTDNFHLPQWVRLSHTPVENNTPKSENFHPRFTYHSETLTRKSELSLTTLKTLTSFGGNSHPTLW